MIDFRYHLVSIIAVFLALTVGIVLGTTMLQDPLLDTLRDETAELRGQTEDLRAERDMADRVNAGADRLADAAAEDLLADRLQGLGVVLVQAPGADTDTVASLGERVEEAGGSVTGRIEVRADLVDPGNTAFVDELALQVSTAPSSLEGMSGHEKAGTEVARALAQRPGRGPDGEEEGSEGPEYDPAAALETFAEGGLISVHGEPAGGADALVVVAPSTAGQAGGGSPQAENTVLAAFTSALHPLVEGLVLAGDVPSSRGEGLLARVRREQAGFATVDMAGRPMGDIVAVLALAEDIGGDGGAYGVGEGVRGFMPDPLPEPRAPGSPPGIDEARRAAGKGE